MHASAILLQAPASEMTYCVSGGALNSIHSLIVSSLAHDRRVVREDCFFSGCRSCVKRGRLSTALVDRGLCIIPWDTISLKLVYWRKLNILNTECSGGSKIWQGLVSNPSERGTGGGEAPDMHTRRRGVWGLPKKI